MRVTRFGLGFIALTLALALAAYNTGNNMVYLLAGLLAAFLLVSLPVAVGNLRKLTVRVEPPREVYAGRPARFQVTVGNGRRFLDAYGLQWVLEEGPTSQRWGLPVVPAGEARSIPVTVTFPRRGVRPVSLSVTTSVPFRILSRTRRLPAAEAIVVYPALRPVGRWLQILPGAAAAEGPVGRLEGTDLVQIRPLEAGQDHRRVHWKQTARLAKLMEKVLRDPEAGRVVVWFDPTVPSGSPETAGRFDQACSTALSLLREARRRGIPAGFREGDLHLPLLATEEQYRQAAHRLAVVQPRPGPPSAPLSPGSSAILRCTVDRVQLIPPVSLPPAARSAHAGP